jgi:hypothetical protein
MLKVKTDQKNKTKLNVIKVNVQQDATTTELAPYDICRAKSQFQLSFSK